MFIAQTKQGRMISGQNGTFAQLRKQIEEDGGLTRLGLGDGLDMIQMLGPADGYVFFGTAHDSVRFEDKGGQLCGKLMGTVVDGETVGLYYREETLLLQIESQIRQMTIERDKAEAALQSLHRATMDQDEKNRQLSRMVGVRDAAKLRLIKLADEKAQIPGSGGKIIELSLKFETVKYACNHSDGKEAIRQARDAWLGCVPTVLEAK